MIITIKRHIPSTRVPMAMSASSWTPPVTLSPKLSIWSRAFIIGLAICNASKGFTFRRTLCWNNKRKNGLEYQGLSLLQYTETFPSWWSQTGYSKSWAKTVQRQMRMQKPTKELNKTSGPRFEPLPLVNTVMSHYFCYICCKFSLQAYLHTMVSIHKWHH